MSCLYCGKAISPIRKLRDADFCCAGHRRLHGERLSKVLSRLSAPEPPPAEIATFALRLPVYGATGRPGVVIAALGAEAPALCLPQWRTTPAPRMGDAFVPVALAIPQAPPPAQWNAWLEPPLVWQSKAAAQPVFLPALAQSRVSRRFAPPPPAEGVGSQPVPARAALVSGAVPVRESDVPQLSLAPGSRMLPLAAPQPSMPAAARLASGAGSGAWMALPRRLAPPAVPWGPDADLCGAAGEFARVPIPIAAGTAAPGAAGECGWNAPALAVAGPPAGSAALLATAGPVLSMAAAPAASTPRRADTPLANARELISGVVPVWGGVAGSPLSPGPVLSLAATEPSSLVQPARPEWAAFASRAALAPEALPTTAGAWLPGTAPGVEPRAADFIVAALHPAETAPPAAAPASLPERSGRAAQGRLAWFALAGRGVSAKLPAAGFLDSPVQPRAAASGPTVAAALPAAPMAIGALSLRLASSELPVPVMRMSGPAGPVALPGCGALAWQPFAARTVLPAPTLPSRSAAACAGFRKVGLIAAVESRPAPAKAAVACVLMDLGPVRMPFSLRGHGKAALPSPAPVFSGQAVPTPMANAAPAHPSGPVELGAPRTVLELPLFPVLRFAAGTPAAAGPALACGPGSLPAARPPASRLVWAAPPEHVAHPSFVVSRGSGEACPPRPTPAPAGAAKIASESAVPLAGTERGADLRGPIQAFRWVLPGTLECSNTAMTGPGMTPRLELVCRERRSSPTWCSRWMPTAIELHLAPFAVEAAQLSLRDLLNHSQRSAEHISISRIVTRQIRKSPAVGWSRLPRDLQAIAASMVVAAALWAGWTATHDGDSARTPITAQNDVAGRSTGPVAWLREAIATRAVVEIGERFGTGMDVWNGAENKKSAAWSYSAAGPGRKSRVALYRPSLPLTDYRLEFLAQIEKRSAGWVVRARNPQNYYALDLRVTKPGPRPMLSLIRYPVVEGREGRRVETPISLRLGNNIPYRIAMEIKGRQFAASIEGQQVDSWSEDTLPAGGVGFFNETGARAKVYWVKVTNNDDLLGRICGSIATAFGSGSGKQAWLGRPGFFFAAATTRRSRGPASQGPAFVFATATATETPGAERSITDGLPKPGDGRG